MDIIDISDIIWSSKWFRPIIYWFNMDDRMFQQMHASVWALMDLSKSYICICKIKKSYHRMLGLEITLIRKWVHEKERIFFSCTLFATSLRPFQQGLCTGSPKVACLWQTPEVVSWNIFIRLLLGCFSFSQISSLPSIWN